MNVIASSGQLRAGYFRWALFLVPSVLLLGLLSGRIAGSDAGGAWFNALVKPAAFPPPVTFAIVWSVLYVLMGLACAMIAAARGAPGRVTALTVFAVQLVLNLAWSPVFFGAHRLSGALVVIGLLDIAVIATIVLFQRVRPVAALLLVPYLLWALFATYLNWTILEANPRLDGVELSGAVQRITF
ncbi:TspO/MBR family protein [Novosphingobium album (ex Liu et al. 2023)]|uniref:Tryptophan-rich sensory protein n=1 Tax=Novosphingobium album (ex Liu et al. 2023) TaxID=3031130 RepID=A0ABT5WTV9_9SPHN|nr:TspO/MBR family protein [Novosphingobium album (ex Liu et al. 2023)]MDE8653316.1 tryptophan-rich sensory protein [Novosphingobium album (ex Liu et al. 2023)]